MKAHAAIDGAVDYVRENSGRHFAPLLVDRFLQERAEIEAIRERFAEPDVKG